MHISTIHVFGFLGACASHIFPAFTSLVNLHILLTPSYIPAMLHTHKCLDIYTKSLFECKDTRVFLFFFPYMSSVLNANMSTSTYTKSRFECKDTEVFLFFISSVASVLSANICI